MAKYIFFKLLFGSPMANFGPLSRRQSQSPNFNHCISNFWPEDQREPQIKVGWISLAEHYENFIIALTTVDEISDLIHNLKSTKVFFIVFSLKSWKDLKK